MIIKHSRHRRSVGSVLFMGFLCGVALVAAALWINTPKASAVVRVKAPSPKRLLVVTVTKGFRHGDSIAVAETVLAGLGERSKSFSVDYVRTDEEMAQKMTREALKAYDGVVFASTTGELPLPDREGFLEWLKEGHAFIGMHAASDTFHKWQPYLDMVGGQFQTHGRQVKVTCLVQDKKHPATKKLGASFEVFDEIYQFKNFDRTRSRALIDMNEHPNDKTPGYYPVAWCHNYGKGKVFYTSLGHRVDVWNAPWYQDHILGGIKWALGQEKGDAKPQYKPTAAEAAALKAAALESKKATNGN